VHHAVSATIRAGREAPDGAVAGETGTKSRDRRVIRSAAPVPRNMPTTMWRQRTEKITVIELWPSRAL
jgi:hypothetical protein